MESNALDNYIYIYILIIEIAIFIQKECSIYFTEISE